MPNNEILWNGTPMNESQLLGALKDARTEAEDPVGGQDAYRVAVTAAPGALDVLLPGVGDHVTGKLWLAADSKRLSGALAIERATIGSYFAHRRPGSASTICLPLRIRS